MAIDAAAALETAQQAYLDNAPPFASITQCENYIRACAQLLMLVPTTSGSREGNVGFDVQLISKQHDKAEEWRQANGGGSAAGTAANSNQPSRIVRASLRNFRD